MLSKSRIFTKYNAFAIIYNQIFRNNQTMSQNALLILSDGAEEMEVVITADVLRRANIDVTIAGLNGSQPVKCSRNVVIIPDKPLSEAKQDYDVVILPGGLGSANNLSQSAEVGEILRNQESRNKLIAAICAAPTALHAHSIGVNKNITSHPLKADVFKNSSYNYLENRVVIDGQLITSRGPGTTFEFALAIVEKLCGINKVKEITPPMIL